MMRSSVMVTYIDIIEKAIEIISCGDPPFSWSSHGECCPWCAISKAASELTASLSPRDAILYWDIELESDKPLIFAREALNQWNGTDPYSVVKSQALDILSQAREIKVIDGAV